MLFRDNPKMGKKRYKSVGAIRPVWQTVKKWSKSEKRVFGAPLLSECN